jgi:hypothetical protein
MCPSELISWNCGLDLQILFMVQGGITMRKFRRQILSFFIFDSCSLLPFPVSPHVCRYEEKVLIHNFGEEMNGAYPFLIYTNLYGLHEVR